VKPCLFVLSLVLNPLLAAVFFLSFNSGVLAADQDTGKPVHFSCLRILQRIAPSNPESLGFEPLVVMTPPVLMEGWASFTPDLIEEERKIELPSIVLDSLRGDPNLRIIVLAGNTLYENTRHNLGFHFGDYLIEHAGAVGATQNAQGPENGRYRVFETLNILYDDGSGRSGDRWLFSEPETFRTPQMEIFTLELPNGQRVAILRPIGDYNEIGDVLAPVLDVTGVPIHQVLLVHDDLRETEGSLSFYEGPQDPRGNNAVFSVNRALSFAIISKIIDRMKEDETFGPFLAPFPLEVMNLKLRLMASLREGTTAFRNLNTILIPIQNILKKLVQNEATKIILEREGGAELKVLKRERAELQQRLPEKAEETQSGMSESLAALHSRIQEIEKKMTSLKSSLKTDYQTLNLDVERIVREGLSYRRLAIGTGAPEGMTDFVDFVLGNFPPEKFDTNFWEVTWKRVSEYLQQPQ
jgi:peptidyl-tRNA hydrolase